MSHRWACLLGHPVAHSLSPALHNVAFQRLGINANYEAWDVPEHGLQRAVDALRREDCMGANVTAPHKQAVVSLLDRVEVEVEALGALNTIVNTRGTLVGANTDAAGLVRWMRACGIDPDARECVVLGAGGAARAVVWALASLGATTVLVLNRTPQRAHDVVTALQPHLAETRLIWGNLTRAGEPAASPTRVLVNATSLGHYGQSPTVHPSWYSRDSVAVDLVYSPPDTAFMAAARSHGARAENGLGMLLHQAALAFERWTGREPPLALFEDVVRQKVAP